MLVCLTVMTQIKVYFIFMTVFLFCFDYFTSRKGKRDYVSTSQPLVMDKVFTLLS